MTWLGVLIYLLLAYLLFRWFQSGKHIAHWSWVFPTALTLRVFSALALGYLYLHHWGGGDTWAFHDNATKIYRIWQEDKMAFYTFLTQNILDESISSMEIAYLNEPRAMLFSKILACCMLIIGPSYFANAILFAVISFGCAFYYYQIFSHYFPKIRSACITSILLLPSLLFWASGILKESLTMAAMFLLLAIFVDYYYRQKAYKWQWALLFISFICIASLKYYHAMLFFPFYIATFLTAVFIYRYKRQKPYFWIVWLAFLLIFAFMGTLSHPNLSLSRIAEVIYENNLIYRQGNLEKIIVFDLDGSWVSVISSAPLALLAGILTPLPMVPDGIFAWLALAESMVFLLAGVFSLVFLDRGWNLMPRRFYLQTLLFIFLAAIFLSLATPNPGTLHRYRIIYFPFLCLFFSSIFFESLKQVFSNNIGRMTR